MSERGDESSGPSTSLEFELDPQRGQRNLATGVLFFRVVSLVWMIVLNLAGGGFSRPALAYLSLAAATAWTAWLFTHREEQHRSWALWFDLALSTYLILVSAYVVPAGGVVSPNRLFFATAYPVSTPLMWGMSRGLLGGLGSALVLSVALGLTRPLSGVDYSDLAHFVGVANGSAYYFIAGGTMAAIAKALDAQSRGVRRAVAVAMEEQERSRWADTAREVHGKAENTLGWLRRQLLDLVAPGGLADPGRLDDPADRAALDAKLGELAGFAGAQQQRLSDWIHRDLSAVAPGFVNLGEVLKELRASVPGITTTVSVAGRIVVPREVADGVCDVVEEALRNVDKHAGVREAVVFGEIDGDALLLTVRDNGRGFEAAREDIGVRGMRDRVDALGGTIRIRSALGFGTTVELRIPADGWRAPEGLDVPGEGERDGSGDGGRDGAA